MKIKTRFAPSPTGYLHLGSARTALYSWLFARHLGGKFVLRIEDTDLQRSTKSAIDAIISSMKWLKLDWDEGPFFQTSRFNRYNAIINDMLNNGSAYKCYCSKERLEKLRKTQIECGQVPRYDLHCRNHDNDNSSHKTYVVRFSNPQNGSVVFNDLIRGPIEFQNKDLDDLIIRRTDGSPTYNFCVVVDDYDMQITHVIRGEEHINNTPRQINILKALGVPLPHYAHVSMILGKDGKKLSKRHGAVGVMQYRDDGFLPEALINYLVRLGWSHGNQEIFSVNEIIQLFSLNVINKSSTLFNKDKLLWLNHYYINHLPINYVSKQLLWHFKKQTIDIRTGPKLVDLLKLLSNRCKTLKEIAENSRYFYEDFDEFNIKEASKYLSPLSSTALQAVRASLASIQEWTPDIINLAIKKTAEELKVSIKTIGMPLRVAVTGTSQSPPLNVTIHAIGKLRSLSRIDMALNFIDTYEICS